MKKELLLGVFLFCGGIFSSYAQVERTRQIHLDFHTSEMFPVVGNKWEKTEWQETLKKGHVNSVNIFAKCHHGWCYYNTKVGKRHPKLDFDLFKAQLDACHEIGISAQAYITVGWNVLDAREHPDWVSTGKDGVNQFEKMEKSVRKDESFPWGFPTMSPEGPYLEHLKKHTEEVAKNYDVDGFWFDIVPVGSVNYNEWSKADMTQNGIDWNDDEAAWNHHCKKMHKFFSEINSIIKKYRPQATIYYNWTTPMGDERIMREKYYQYNTKQDLEDLPTTWAGYDVFPVRAKYYANTGSPIVAMSGKFHSAWGEFGGFKHKKAILYEAANMMAFGAFCNFGDQLHPTGKLENATYENIGYAYEYIEKIEPYCIGAENKARVGLWINFTGKDNMISKLLLEGQINFVVANNLKDWKDLEVLVIHSGVRLTDEETSRIQKFVDEGGKLMILGRGASEYNRCRFDIGADMIYDPNYKIDYTYVGDSMKENLVQSPFLNRLPAYRIYPSRDVEILASIYEPYWDRTVEHWTGHDNTAYQTEPAKHPAVIRKGNILWCAHELEAIYDSEGSQVHKQLFLNSLHKILRNPFVSTEMPSCGRINLMHQKKEMRYIVHLTYGTPHKRGRASVIEDLVPLHNTPVSVKFKENIKSVYLIPSGEKLEMKKNGDRIDVIVPEFTCHTGIVFEY